MSVSKHIASAALIVPIAIGTATGSSSSAFADPYVAARACILDISGDYYPVRVLSISPDGLGDYDVILRDIDGDIWDCNVGPNGYIYWNKLRR